MLNYWQNPANSRETKPAAAGARRGCIVAIASEDERRRAASLRNNLINMYYRELAEHRAE